MIKSDSHDELCLFSDKLNSVIITIHFISVSERSQSVS